MIRQGFRSHERRQRHSKEWREREREGDSIAEKSHREKVSGQGYVEFVHGFLAAFGAALIIQTIRTCLKTFINYTFIAN